VSWRLRALLLESSDRGGGWCRAVVENGFTFDYAGHIMFSDALPEEKAAELCALEVALD
jgi:protoporphyrinogen oxidase